MKLPELKIGDLTAKIPVIQGGMGIGISLNRLAGTVAAEGGIGILSTAQIGFQEENFQRASVRTNLQTIKKQLDKARSFAKGGFSVSTSWWRVSVMTMWSERQSKPVLM